MAGGIKQQILLCGPELQLKHFFAYFLRSNHTSGLDFDRIQAVYIVFHTQIEIEPPRVLWFDFCEGKVNDEARVRRWKRRPFCKCERENVQLIIQGAICNEWLGIPRIPTLRGGWHLAAWGDRQTGIQPVPGPTEDRWTTRCNLSNSNNKWANPTGSRGSAPESEP